MIKLLAIDDEFDVRTIISCIAEEHGFKCFLAANGVDGVRLAIQEKPDVILLDLMMPGMNGKEVMEELTRRQIGARIIICTAQNSPQTIVEFIKAGASDYLVKPF